MTRLSRPGPFALPSGIDRLLADGDRLEILKHRRAGLLTNAGCRTADGVQSANALNEALAGPPGSGLTSLFAPEHGFATDFEAGASVADHRDGTSGIGVISLYGERQAPAPEHLAAIDVLIVDLRDVGVRCYTYAATAAMAVEAALDTGLDVIICDRENPLGTATDGPPLDPDFKSFLAYFAVPFVHGQTLGSLVAGILESHPRLNQLTVIPAGDGKTPGGGAWVPPSPALTTLDTIRFYPGLVLFEGTNLSEGRGTPLSFRCIGAPWLDAATAAAAANGWPTGIAAAACEIQPTTGDHAGQALPAIRFERTAEQCDGLGLGVRLLAWIAGAHPEFSWKANSGDRPMIDTLLGGDSLRKALERGDSADDILAMWRD